MIFPAGLYYSPWSQKERTAFPVFKFINKFMAKAYVLAIVNMREYIFVW